MIRAPGLKSTARRLKMLHLFFIILYTSYIPQSQNNNQIRITHTRTIQLLSNGLLYTTIRDLQPGHPDRMVQVYIIYIYIYISGLQTSGDFSKSLFFLCVCVLGTMLDSPHGFTASAGEDFFEMLQCHSVRPESHLH